MWKICTQRKKRHCFIITCQYLVSYTFLKLPSTEYKSETESDAQSLASSGRDFCLPPSSPRHPLSSIICKKQEKGWIGCISFNTVNPLVNVHHCISVIILDSLDCLFLPWSWKNDAFFLSPLFHLIVIAFIEALIPPERRLQLLWGVQLWTAHRAPLTHWSSRRKVVKMLECLSEWPLESEMLNWGDLRIVL